MLMEYLHDPPREAHVEMMRCHSTEAELVFGDAGATCSRAPQGLSEADVCDMK